MSEQDPKAVFKIECSELLDVMEESLLNLESNKEDVDSINSVFRAMHTIKGSAGILGMEQIEKFAHKVENLLESVRKGIIQIDDTITDILLKSKDHILRLIEVDEGGSELTPEEIEIEKWILGEVARYLGEDSQPQNRKTEPISAVSNKDSKDEISSEERVSSENWHISLRFKPEVMMNGMDPYSFIIYLQKMGEIIHLTTITDRIPDEENYNPEYCYLGFEIDLKSDFDKKDIEGVFEFVQDDCEIRIIPPKSVISSYINLIEELPEDVDMIGEILLKGGALTEAELQKALKKQNSFDESNKPRIGEILVDEKIVPSQLVDVALSKQKQIRENKTKESKTIRIDTDKLDYLINLVGELVIAGANISSHGKRLGDPALIESASSLTRIIELIRDRSMDIRMVPIGETFSRFKRLVRDLGKEVGKEIDLIIDGGDTELDKTVIEKINDPLIHLIRNSIDHGIESIEERTAKGKPPKGTIKLNAYNDAGSIVIEVSDDGRGLNKEKIIAKAIDKGLISPSSQLTDQEIYRLIFLPGFSTAEQVTKISGRGVGMDVVKKNIDELRGTVDIESKLGEGTTVSIRLPLTLAIIDGFMVGVGKNLSRYIIPLDMVVECVEFSAAKGSHNPERHYLNLRGETLPYIKLCEVFEEPEDKTTLENIVIVRYGDNKIGIVVNELFGEIQTVVKSLGNFYKNIEGISGATILGDGDVALILDIPNLIRSVERVQ